MKQFMKINLLVLFALSIGTPLRAMHSAKFASGSSVISRELAVKKYLTSLSLSTVTALSKNNGGFSTNALLASSQPARDKPHFTAENIEKYFQTDHHSFVQQALTHIGSTDIETIEALQYALQRNISCFTDAVEKHPQDFSIEQFDALFEQLNMARKATRSTEKIASIATEILRIKDIALQKYGTPDIDYATEFMARKNPFKKAAGYPAFLLPRFSEFYKQIRSLSTQECLGLSIDTINWMYAYNYQNKKFKHFDTLSSPQALHLFAPQCTFKSLAFKDALNVLCLQHITEKNMAVGYGDPNKEFFINQLAQTGALQMPYFMYTDISASLALLDFIVHNIAELSVHHINCLYDHVFTSRQDRQKIKAAARSHFKHSQNIVNFTLDDNDVIPHFLFEEIQHPQTLSDYHSNQNLDAIATNILPHESFKQKNVKNMFVQAYMKQKEEQGKARYVFFHGRVYSWDFVSDMYKHAYNSIHPDAKVDDNYVFLRFGIGLKSRFTYASEGRDALWMNGALYGNAQRLGSCTASYILDNRDFSGGPTAAGISSKAIFTRLGLERSYDTYCMEIMKLEQLHVQAHANKIGSLLAVSIPHPQLGLVRVPSLSEQCSVQMMESGEVADDYEFVLPLTADYALDPYKGPRIYSFNAADPVKYKAYEQYRDTLFAKIARDIQTDKAINTSTSRAL